MSNSNLWASSTSYDGNDRERAFTSYNSLQHHSLQNVILSPILDSNSNPQARCSLPSIRTLDVHQAPSFRGLPSLDSLDLYQQQHESAREAGRRELRSPFQSSMSPRDRYFFKRAKACRHSRTSSVCSSTPPSSPSSSVCYPSPQDNNVTSYPGSQNILTRSYSYPQSSHQAFSLFPVPNTSHFVDDNHLASATGRSNKAYTHEEVHFIIYMRDDRKMQWTDIVKPFNDQFNKKASRGALECRYYRAQLFPKFSNDGSILYDERGELIMEPLKVRDRKELQRAGGIRWEKTEPYTTLVGRCPSLILQYEWTDPEDKRKAKAIVQSGAPLLPGASAIRAQ